MMAASGCCPRCCLSMAIVLQDVSWSLSSIATFPHGGAVSGLQRLHSSEVVFLRVH
eukprot:m.217382 g.217382  ORF g.217382 m.217382 type:complete len:56 (-) comp17203_c0_seq40:3010-3177(-)